MRSENPVRGWLSSNAYGGTWVPVAGLGGWLGPASVPVLFPRGESDVMLASADWPLQLGSAGPEIFYTYETGTKQREAILHPEHYLDQTKIEPLVVMFDPPDRRSWLEPIQSFLLFYGASPRWLQNGEIEWEIPDDDGKPDVIAKWTRTPNTEYEGVLRIRRNKLLRFMSTFGFSLAIYYEENISDSSVPHGWQDEERELLRHWRCWATEVSPGDTRVVVRCVTVVEAPESAADEPDYDSSTLEYAIGTDPVTGEPITASYPDAPHEKTTWQGAGRDNFLTPVLFRRDVLDYYYADTLHYTVTNTYVEATSAWRIPLAITENGHVQVWLGDLGRISDTAQRHWKQFNIADDDVVPEWRIRRDLNTQFVGPPETEPLDKLRGAVRRCNELARAYCGKPLFADVEGLSSDRVQTLRVPRSGALPAFQNEVTTLAILLIEHLNGDFFTAAGANSGQSLARLTGWLQAATGKTEAEAKDMIGGLFAIQAIRSKAGGAHRGGTGGIEAMARAGIDGENLSAGFDQLVVGAVMSLEQIASVLESLSTNRA